MVSCSISHVTEGWPNVMLLYDEATGQKWVPFRRMCKDLIDEKMFLTFMAKNREEKRRPDKWITLGALKIPEHLVDNIMMQFEPELRTLDMNLVELDEFFLILDRYGDTWFKNMDAERYELGKRIIYEIAACITEAPKEDVKERIEERVDEMTSVLQNYMDDAIRAEAIRRYCCTDAFKRDREEVLRKELEKEVEKELKKAKK